MNITSQHRKGWRPSRPDPRDRRYNFHGRMLARSTPLPDSVDLRPKCPPVYDQGEIGSCTGNLAAFLLEYDMIQQQLPSFTPSRLFIYYNELAIENALPRDAGAEIRTAIKAVNQFGAPPEVLWPYDVTRFAEKPNDEAFKQALLVEALQYESVDQQLQALKTPLAAGQPVGFGFTCYAPLDSDDVAQRGYLPMPDTQFDVPTGGHAVSLVGYDEVKRLFLVRNSWGAGWGIGGYFWMPYDYVLNPGLASDFWVVSVVGPQK